MHVRTTLALTLMLSGSSGCGLATVVGERDLQGGNVDSEQGTGGAGDLPSLDLPEGDCDPPTPISCDADSDDPLNAVGLDCLGGTPASGGVTAEPAAVAVRSGTLGPYEIREGEKLLVLSTGRANQVGLSQDQLAQLGCDEPDYCPSTDFMAGPITLPDPIDVTAVSDTADCAQDPSLIGTGDCSNTLYAQWATCMGGCEVWDYAELRVAMTVPAHSHGLAFDFAFMTVEWPWFVGGGFNDMFVAWLESETWTGNVSFDDLGHPITVNAGFTDYTADEFDGMAFEGHAGTRWLTTGFGLAPGETIELVLAVFDLSDGDHDSVVLLDAFRWTCTTTAPTTQPVP